MRNIVFGTMYIDFYGVKSVINHKTGERIEVQFYERGWSTESYITANVYDSNNEIQYKLKGSWFDKISLVNCKTGEEELIWTQDEPIKDFERQFGFNKLAVLLNYVNDEMKQVLPMSDTRLRGDQRLFEEGKVDEADAEKQRVEIKQRVARKNRADQCIEWEANFFTEQSHRFIEGERRY